MKINKMTINNYGCFNKKEIEFADGISIIKGDNESGKSTTHQAMLDLMFGFLSTGRKNSFKISPKAQSFNGGSPKIDGQCSAGGQQFKVSRYFDGAVPRLSVEKNGVIDRLDNVALDALGGLSRETYEGIYSLDIDSIVKLKDSWEQEQDSILVGLRSDILLPNEQIINNLDKNIKEAWKAKSNTGKAREMSNAIADLKSQLNEAMDRQNELRDVERQEEETTDSIKQCKSNIEKLEKERIYLARQKDFYTEYAEINDVLIKNSDVKKYEQIPKDIVNYLDTLDKSNKEGVEKSKEIKDKIDNLEETQKRYELQKEKLKQCEKEVPRAEKIVQALKMLKDRITRDNQKENEKKSRILDKVKMLFTNSFAWEKFSDLEKVDIAECLSIWDKISANRAEKAQVLQLARENYTPAEKNGRKDIDKIDILFFLTAAVGLMMIFVPLGIDRLISVIAGSVILIGAIIAIYIKISKISRIDADEFDIELAELDEEYSRLKNKLQLKLNFDFIPSEMRANPDESLIKDIAQIKYDYEDYLAAKKELDEGTDQYSQIEKEINQIAINVLGNSIDYNTDMAQMRTKYEELRKLKEQAIGAASEVGALNDQLMDIDSKNYSIEKTIKEINDVLFDLTGTDTKDKARHLVKMREDYMSAVSRSQLLKRRYSDYEELEKNIDKSVQEKLYEADYKLVRAGEKLASIRDEEKELIRYKSELSTKKEHLINSGLSPAIIDGRLQELYEERENRIKLRDEYALVYGIIQKARDKFMSERSPEFLVTAGRYLSLITDNRYDRIKLSKNSTSIMVSGGEGRIYDFEEIDSTMSRGTKEQVYFALRLAMLERFDPDGSKLPIVLDEALVNWDMNRFTKLMKIVSSISNERQVFMFTCHDYMVDIIKNVGNNYRVINI